MPECDGREDTRAIRALPGRAAGRDEQLGKPVEPAHFYATVLRWLAPDEPAG